MLPRFSDMDAAPWPGRYDHIVGYALLSCDDCQQVYDHFFTDGPKRQGVRRESAIPPGEGMALYVPNSKWEQELSSEDWLWLYRR